MRNIQITKARAQNVPDILQFIRELAVFEKLEQEMVATEQALHDSLFGARPFAEVIFLEEDGKKVAFALFFHNYSTFLAKPGLYLEDLFVKTECRGKGYGKRLLTYLAQLAVERGCGRFEWSVLDWNQSALEFYRALGAEPMSEWTVQRVSGQSLVDLAKQAVDDLIEVHKPG